MVIVAADKAKEAVKHRNKQKFQLEITRTLEDLKKLEYGLINLQGNVTNSDDVDATCMNIMNGTRRDIQLGIQNNNRIERLLKAGD